MQGFILAFLFSTFSQVAVSQTLTTSVAVDEEQDSIEVFADNFVKQASLVLNDKEASSSEKLEKIYMLCLEAVDIEGLSKSSLGRYYKKLETDERKKRYADLLERYVIGLYSDLLTSLEELTFEKVGELKRLPDTGKAYITYHFFFGVDDKEPKVVKFSINIADENMPKFVDVSLNAISPLASVGRYLKKSFRKVKDADKFLDTFEKEIEEKQTNKSASSS